MKKKTVAITAGRFQVPQLTSGHCNLLQRMRDAKHDAIGVFLGSSIYPNRNNPLDFLYRSNMIKRQFQEHHRLTTFNIIDERDDHVWSEKFDKMIAEQYPRYNVVLFGGRDSFILRYHGIHKDNFQEHNIESESGTTTRQNIDINYDRHFAEGMTYALNNQYPIIRPTVDIIAYDMDTLKMVVIFKDSDNGMCRFPGGHVDLKDPNMLYAAGRELKEETAIDRPLREFTYFASFKVMDWRFLDKNQEGVMTSLYLLPFDRNSNPIIAGDDADDIAFMEPRHVKDVIVPEHRPLFESVMKHHPRFSTIEL